MAAHVKETRIATPVHAASDVGRAAYRTAGDARQNDANRSARATPTAIWPRCLSKRMAVHAKETRIAAPMRAVAMGPHCLSERAAVHAISGMAALLIGAGRGAHRSEPHRSAGARRQRYGGAAYLSGWRCMKEQRASQRRPRAGGTGRRIAPADAKPQSRSISWIARSRAACTSALRHRISNAVMKMSSRFSSIPWNRNSLRLTVVSVMMS